MSKVQTGKECLEIGQKQQRLEIVLQAVHRMDELSDVLLHDLAAAKVLVDECIIGTQDAGVCRAHLTGNRESCGAARDAVPEKSVGSTRSIRKKSSLKYTNFSLRPSIRCIFSSMGWELNTGRYSAGM